MTTDSRTSIQRRADRVLAVLCAVLCLGFPLLASRTLLDGSRPSEYHGPSFWLGVLTAALVCIVAVHSWRLWTGRVRAADDAWRVNRLHAEINEDIKNDRSGGRWK